VREVPVPLPLREFARDLLRTKVYMYSVELNAAIDTRSYINLIPLKVAQMFSVALRKSPKMIIVPIDNRLCLFYSAIDDLPISISDITIPTNTLVAKETSSDILLGRV
jgi:hypothetical protein